MEAKTIAGIAILGGGLYLGYELLKGQLASASSNFDGAGNPLGTCYDASGQPAPPTLLYDTNGVLIGEECCDRVQRCVATATGPLFEEEITEEEMASLVAWKVYDGQKLRTTPAGASGGLRYDGSCPLLDGRFVSYGVLSSAIHPHTTRFLVCVPSTCTVPWVFGATYRVTIEEEILLVRAGRPTAQEIGHGYGNVAFTILDRPALPGWENAEQIHLTRVFANEEERARWPQYQGLDPVYYPTRRVVVPGEGPEQLACQDLLHTDATYTVWVQEVRHNCQHQDYGGPGNHLIWDPIAGQCVPMSADEIAAHEAEVAAAAAEREEAAERSRWAANGQCNQRFQVSCDELEKIRRFWDQVGAPSEEERRARNTRLAPLLSYPTNITTILLCDSAEEEMLVSRYLEHMFVGEEARNIRSMRGRERELITAQDLEFRRDLYSLLHGPAGIGVYPLFGDGVLMVLGGYWCFRAIWEPPPILRPKPSPVVASRVRPGALVLR